MRSFESGRLWPHIAATAREALIGLGLGFLAGVTLGFIAALKGLVGELVEPVMLLLNSVPRIVLAPIFILWLGIGPNSKIASAFFLVFVVIFFAVYTGLREVPPSLVARVRVLGGGRWALLTQVYVPSVLTWIFSSLRITVGFAFTGAVVAEVIASTEGLGYLLNFAQNSFQRLAEDGGGGDHHGDDHAAVRRARPDRAPADALEARGRLTAAGSAIEVCPGSAPQAGTDVNRRRPAPPQPRAARRPRTAGRARPSGAVSK